MPKRFNKLGLLWTVPYILTPPKLSWFEVVLHEAKLNQPLFNKFGFDGLKPTPSLVPDLVFKQLITDQFASPLPACQRVQPF
jgi:hypothetical protein